VALGCFLFMGQSDVPISLARLTPGSLDASGHYIVFGSAIGPDGTLFSSADMYLGRTDTGGVRRLTQFGNDLRSPAGVTAVTMSADGTRVAYTALIPSGGVGVEEVHLIDVDTGLDRALVADGQGCPTPLIACINCFFFCLGTPHLSPDSANVLYSARRTNPFRVVSAEGSSLQLPVYSGTLAPAPKRVISDDGAVVFTSSAVVAPTAATPLATDVYVMRLNGRGIRNVTRFLTNSSLVAQNAVISGDGSTIVFEASSDPSAGGSASGSQVWVVGTDGSNLRQLTFGGEPSSSPSLSADGSLVAFLQRGRVWVARVTGRSLPAALTPSGGPIPQDVTIAEDGSRVVYSVGPTEGERHAIYTVGVDGGNLRAVYDPSAAKAAGAPRILSLGGRVP